MTDHTDRRAEPSGAPGSSWAADGVMEHPHWTDDTDWWDTVPLAYLAGLQHGYAAGYAARDGHVDIAHRAAVQRARRHMDRADRRAEFDGPRPAGPGREREAADGGAQDAAQRPTRRGGAAVRVDAPKAATDAPSGHTGHHGGQPRPAAAA